MTTETSIVNQPSQLIQNKEFITQFSMGRVEYILHCNVSKSDIIVGNSRVFFRWHDTKAYRLF